jgi:hypothetical protein
MVPDIDVAADSVAAQDRAHLLRRVHRGKPIEEAPRWCSAPARAGAPARWIRPPQARALPLHESFDEGGAISSSPKCQPLEDPTSARPRRKSRWWAVHNHMEDARVPVGSQGRVGQGQEEINLRYAPPSKWPTATCSKARGGKDRLAAGARPSPSWRITTWGVHRPSISIPRCGTARKKALFASAIERARRSSSGWPGRWPWRASSPTSTRPPSAPTSYQAGSFAPTRIACGWDNRTCGPALRRRRWLPRGEPHPEGRRGALPSRPPSPAGLHRVDRSSSRPSAATAMPTRIKARPGAKALREAIGELSAQVARDAFRDTVVKLTCITGSSSGGPTNR